jgi:hypothetical protein
MRICTCRRCCKESLAQKRGWRHNATLRADVRAAASKPPLRAPTATAESGRATLARRRASRDAPNVAVFSITRPATGVMLTAGHPSSRTRWSAAVAAVMGHEPTIPAPSRTWEIAVTFNLKWACGDDMHRDFIMTIALGITTGLVVTTPALAICIAGFGTCNVSLDTALRGQIVRGQVFWVQPSGSSPGTLIHFAKDGRRCVSFAAVRWNGKQTDEKSSFCFGPGETHIMKSPVAARTAVDSQTKQQVKLEMYYTAHLEVNNDGTRLEYQQCAKRETQSDFTCRSDWSLWSFKINDRKCDIKVYEPGLSTIIDTTCEVYADD